MNARGHAAVRNRLRIRMGAAGATFARLLLWQLQPRLGLSAAQLRPVDHMSRLRCPVFVIGGMEDRHTTAAETKLLYDAAREPRRLWLIPRAGHVDFFEAAGDAYRQRVLEFLADSFAAAAPARGRVESGRLPR